MPIAPNLFLVGAPKCGTTALDSYLKQHPDIFMAERKESHYFAGDFHGPLYIRGLDSYLGLFSDAGECRRVGESSVYYLSSQSAPGAIKAFAPEAKIIVMLRNPAEMIYSNHSQLLFSGFENIRDFRRALGAESDRKAGKQLPPNLPISANHLFYRDAARYAGQVEKYFEVFGRENVHVVLFDDFKRDTAEAFRDTLRFLEVDCDFTPSFDVVNPNARTRSRLLRRTLTYPGNSLRALVKILLPSSSLRYRVKRFLGGINTETAPRRPMDPAVREELTAEFSPEVERLGELLGRDLSSWRRK